ncbi:MAG: hypothetical protein HOO08_09335, partial [Opitutae bacterium]|nr:hypothetical protein [Opitutae bacterium]
MMKTKLKIIAIVVGMFALASVHICGGTSLSPASLRSEYHVNPVGMDVTQPRLSWTIVAEADGRGARQTAYRVLVASSLEQLAANRGDLWDTKKVNSDQTNQLVYAGAPLQSQMQCFWKVMTWDEVGKASDWSAPASWSMGLLNSDDWQAGWIGLDQAPKNKPEYRAALDGKNPKLVIKKAIYGVLDDPAKQMDLKAIVQAHVDGGALLLTPSNDFAGKDPADETKKKLQLEYTVDDRMVKATVEENKELDLSIGRK